MVKLLFTKVTLTKFPEILHSMWSMVVIQFSKMCMMSVHSLWLSQSLVVTMVPCLLMDRLVAVKHIL